MTQTDYNAVQKRLLDSDRVAFGTFCTLTYDRVATFLFAIGVARYDLEDLAQDTYVALWNHRRNVFRFPDLRHVMGWVLKTARRKAIDTFRASRRHEPIESVPHPVSRESDPAEEVASRDQFLIDRDRLLAGLEQLPAAEREVVVLRYLQGFTTEEISEILDRPQNTIRSQLYRGISSLKSHFERVPA